MKLFLSLFSLLFAVSTMMAQTTGFTYGADVSWMTFQEDCGIKFYKGDETTLTTVEDLLQDYGFNAARLRVWVNPENYAKDANFSTAGYCNKEDVIKKARRLAAKGQEIMLCFHFSDTWADPGKQRIPAAWASAAKDLNALKALVVDHVKDVCQALKDEGITVKWVQIGNEDNTGFMTHNPTGGDFVGCLTGVSASGSTGYITVFNAAAAAARSVFPATKIVHHLANGQDFTKLNWNLQKVLSTSGSVAENTKIDADLVGLSLYPLSDNNTMNWHSYAESCIQSMKSIKAAYNINSIVVEVGMNNDYSSATSGTSQKAHTEQCNKDVSEFADYFIAHAKRSGVCEGVFYWEPQSSYTSYSSTTSVNGQSGYTLGAMMDVQRKTSTWGARTKLTPNAYWDKVKAFAGGYMPEDDEPVTPAEWYFKYSLNDKLTWTLAPMELDSVAGIYTLKGISDATAQYCLNYFIVRSDEKESYIASEAVKADVLYPLYPTLSGAYAGWTGWLDGKWLQESHVIQFNPGPKTLQISKNASVGSIEVDEDSPVEYFSLQGYKISTPVSGMLVIRRQGAKVDKVIMP